MLPDQVLPDKLVFIPKPLLAFCVNPDFPQPDSRINWAREIQANIPVFYWSAVKSGPTVFITSVSDKFFNEVAWKPIFSFLIFAFSWFKLL